ncbi:MAG: C40 family peptidase [Nocardioidaceae bacterium]|nr:C40 family peptidase [Nocardioidaceae bacterium]
MLSSRLRSRLVAVALTVVSIVAATTVLQSVTSAADASASHPHVAKALKVARAQKGDPYNYGSNGPNAFDCSGLTQYSFKKAGIRLPRTSDQQANYVRRLKDKNNIRPGDFMFFADGGDVYHMGIFTGKWQGGRRLILHASRSGTPVKVDPVWTSDWFAGTIRHR